VKDEAQAALDRGTLIPVLIESVKIPYGFGQYQALDLTDWDETASHPAMVRLLGEIARVIKAPAVVPRRTISEALRGAYRRHRGVVVGAVVALGLVLGYVTFTGGLASLFEKSDALDPTARAARTDAIGFTVKGLAEAAQSNYGGAVVFYNEAITKYQKYPDAYFYRGQSHAILKQGQRAIEDFKQFLALAAADAPDRAEAQDYLRSLEARVAPPITLPTRGPVAASLPAPVPPSPALKALVAEMFAADKTARIRATTKLVVEHKSTPAVVELAVAEARAKTENKAGVINTLVLLEGVDPAILRQHRESIEALLVAVKDNGPMTVEHAAKVRRLLVG
jgi:tetratricopeptide (TPR) repeat protein